MGGSSRQVVGQTRCIFVDTAKGWRAHIGGESKLVIAQKTRDLHEWGVGRILRWSCEHLSESSARLKMSRSKEVS